MKAILYCLWLIVVVNAAQAQTGLDSVAVRRNIVKINPLSLLGADASVFYERGLTKRLAIVVGLGFGQETYTYKYEANVPSPGQFQYERLTIESRYYLTRRHHAPLGVYVGLYSRLARLTIDDYQLDSEGELVRDPNNLPIQEKRQLYVLMPGALAGIQTPIGRRFTLETFLGFHYQVPTQRPALEHIVPEAMSGERLLPRFGLTFGYLF
ncbi:hypothetical protein ACFSUS_11060 [Spirosoma soli]|uniref:DUF3575 domain-containing protein n=1 Tax=Spirosoma soli TaxID=1770529 RepID=A0ABW5M675_9BACT